MSDRETALKETIKILEDAIMAFEFVQNEIMPLAAQGKLNPAEFEDKILGVQGRLADALDKANMTLSGQQEHDDLFSAAMDNFAKANFWFNSAVTGMMVGRQQILGKNDIQFSRALKEAHAMQLDAVKKMQEKMNAAAAAADKK